MARPRRCCRAVRALLRSCYAELLPLEAFVRRLQAAAPPGAQPQPLLQDGDPKDYRALVDRCLVGRPAGARAPPPLLTFQQVSSQDDVVARVVQRICEKKKKNVLAFGYGPSNENSRHLPCMRNICSYQRNSTTETLRQSVLWEIVLSRVGDDVMMYVLEHCSLFMLVPPSCCYQICGQPIYELALRSAKPSPEFFRQRYPRPAPSVLSSYLRGRLQPCGKYLVKANRGEWNSRKQRRRRSQEGVDGDSQQSLKVRRAARLSPTANELVTRSSDYLEDQPSPKHCLCLTAPPRKRKWKDCYEVSAKRKKTTQTDEGLGEETRNPVLSQRKKQIILDVGGDASRGCVRPISEGEVVFVKPVAQRSEFGAQTWGCPAPDNPEVFSCGPALSTESETPCGSSTKTKPRTSVPKVEPCISDYCSVKLVNAAAAADRGLRTSKPAQEFSDRISAPAVQIERRSLLYSCRQLKECLPKSFVLNRLKGYPAGGWRLVETIFLNSKIPKQPGKSSLPGYNRKKKRLPKRYWQMRGVFQELLRNHTKCPYLTVLRNNCPIWELDKIRPGRRSCEQNVCGEGQSLPRRWQANATENFPTGISGALGPFSGASCRSFEKAELHQKGTEMQAPHVSPSSDVTVFLRQHCSHWQVYTFVRSCLQRVVPAVLWGSNHNKCRFYKNVKRFISLGKFSTLSLRELMWKMRVNDCAWLRLTKELRRFVPASEHRFREDLMSKFLYWLMNSFVAELLRSFFYITETMFQKNMLFYFRKAVWRKLQKIGIRSHLAKVQLRALSKEEIEILQRKKCVPLASKLRFIPKANGLRPVVNLNDVVGAEAFCRKSRDQKVQYFNKQLKNLFSVLSYESAKKPILLGSSVFGKDDTYAIWKKFVLKVLESNSEMPRFYFVKADVTGAYDTIPHNKLIEVISQVFALERETSYNIRRYAVIIRTRNGLKRICYRRHVSVSSEFKPDMKQFLCHLQESTSLRNAVIVEQGVSLRENSSSLYEFFLQLIHHSILKIEKKYYVQCCGIPQGCILSTLLCNLCYGDMEDKLLRGVQRDGYGNVNSFYVKHEQHQVLSKLPDGTTVVPGTLMFWLLNATNPEVIVAICERSFGNQKTNGAPVASGASCSHSEATIWFSNVLEVKPTSGMGSVQLPRVLMRLTDDFLLATPHLTEAKAFLRTLAMGVPEYGFVINPGKTVVNFPVDKDIPGCSAFKQLPARTVIPWCGLLIDTHTLEVYCDYSSYACTSIRSSLSFNSSNKAGVSMRNKLLVVLQLKCHSLFLDLQINSLRTVCINIFKILLLQAYRFHACVLLLPFNQQVKNNPSFFLTIISDTASCCFSLLKAKNADITFSPAGGSVALTYKAVQWLCYRAFSVKLGNHRVIYKCLLVPLRQCEIRLLRQIPEASVQLLKKVTEPSLYEDFKAILD